MNIDNYYIVRLSKLISSKEIKQGFKDNKYKYEKYICVEEKILNAEPFYIDLLTNKKYYLPTYHTKVGDYVIKDSSDLTPFKDFVDINKVSKNKLIFTIKELIMRLNNELYEKEINTSNSKNKKGKTKIKKYGLK